MVSMYSRQIINKVANTNLRYYYHYYYILYAVGAPVRVYAAASGT